MPWSSHTFILLLTCSNSTGLAPLTVTCGALPLRPSACLSAPVEYAPEGDRTFVAMLRVSDGKIENESRSCLSFRKYEAEPEL